MLRSTSKLQANAPAGSSSDRSPQQNAFPNLMPNSSDTSPLHSKLRTVSAAQTTRSTMAVNVNSLYIPVVKKTQ